MGRQRLVICVLVLAASCQMQADHTGTQYLCGASEACPSGFVCREARCVAPGDAAPVDIDGADAAATPCGNGLCSAPEDCSSCPQDCPCDIGQGCEGGNCVPFASCGDDTCSQANGEDCAVCPLDCGECCANPQGSCATAPCCTGESCNSFSRCCIPASKTGPLACSGNDDCCNSAIYGGPSICNCDRCCKPVGTNCTSPDECCCAHSCVMGHCE